MQSKIFKLFAYLFIGLFLIVGTFYFGNQATSTKDVPYSTFLTMIESGEVEKVEIGNESLNIYLYNDNRTVYVTKALNDSLLIERLKASEVAFEKIDKPDAVTLLSGFLALLPTVLFLVIAFAMFKIMNGKGGNIIGKQSSKYSLDKSTGVTFADVAGQEEAKESLKEIIDYLENGEKYKGIGAKLPKGALFVGPPGTGKTLLAKAVAGEAKVPFFSLSGSDFVEMFVGVGASRVRGLFEEAKKAAPCIVFIDEIDAIGKTRDARSSNDEREQTLNQLLAEMDGFNSDKAVVVLAATNRPETLDKALLRPGRFDRRIIVDKPDFKGRKATLAVHAKGVKLAKDVDFDAIARATSGAAGADLANIINEAALSAVRLGHDAVTNNDLMEAVEVVFAGKEKKDRIMTEKERRIVSYHEVGHAVVAALQKDSAPVQKITIVPRTMGALGYTMQVPEEEKYLNTAEDIICEITTLVGGRSAEEIFCNTVTTGASNDIERATAAARRYITVFGMSKKFGMVSFESQGNAYLDGFTERTCSESVSAAIDAEIMEIIRNAKLKADKMLADNKQLVEELAEYLLNKENLTGDEFMDIFRKYHPETAPVKQKPAPKKLDIKKEEVEQPKAHEEESVNTVTVSPAVDDFMINDFVVPDEPVFDDPIPEEPIIVDDSPILAQTADGINIVDETPAVEEEPQSKNEEKKNKKTPFSKPSKTISKAEQKEINAAVSLLENPDLFNQKKKPVKGKNEPVAPVSPAVEEKPEKPKNNGRKSFTPIKVEDPPVQKTIKTQGKKKKTTGLRSDLDAILECFDMKKLPEEDVASDVADKVKPVKTNEPAPQKTEEKPEAPVVSPVDDEPEPPDDIFGDF